MSWHHRFDEAILTPLPAGEKLLLLILVHHACEFCGLAWPGARRLIETSGLGERTVQRSLKGLVDRGLIVIHAYPSGGRHRATEYVVMPSLGELSTAPCGKCAANQRKGAAGAGYDKGVTEKPRTRDGVLTKPRHAGAEKGVTSAPPTAIRTEQPGSTVASPPVSSDPLPLELTERLERMQARADAEAEIPQD